MPLALKPLSGPTHDQTLRPSEQHLCFLSKSLGGAFQGFNVMFLWDKGGFKVYVNKEAIKEESKGWTSFLIAAFLWYYAYNIPILCGAPCSRHYTIDMSKWCLQTSPGMLVLKGRTLVEIVRVISEKKNKLQTDPRKISLNIPERRGFQQTPISKTKTWFFGTDLRTHSKNN